MKVFYRSCNGKIFYTKEECLEYEKTMDFKMYGPEGQTNNADECFIVDIKTPEAAENFIEACIRMEAPCDGIQRDCVGFYVWSFSDKKYFRLEPLTCKALKEYFKDPETSTRYLKYNKGESKNGKKN